jgi:hypothetical protein
MAGNRGLSSLASLSRKRALLLTLLTGEERDSGSVLGHSDPALVSNSDVR